MKKIRTQILASGKHIHLSEEELKELFGPDAELRVKKILGDGIMGQFVSDKKVRLSGPDGEHVLSVLGPLRKQTQVELSYTEARQIGLRPPLSDSGKLEETMGCTLIGPAGTVYLQKGMMVARRHIHMNPDEARENDFHANDIVRVQVEGPRGLIFENCLVGIKSKPGRTVMHIDFDEMNAAGLVGDAWGWILKEE